MTNLLDSTLEGYARSFVPDTLCVNHAMESALHKEVSAPISELQKKLKKKKHGKKTWKHESIKHCARSDTDKRVSGFASDVSTHSSLTGKKKGRKLIFTPRIIEVNRLVKIPVFCCCRLTGLTPDSAQHRAWQGSLRNFSSNGRRRERPSSSRLPSSTQRTPTDGPKNRGSFFYPSTP